MTHDTSVMYYTALPNVFAKVCLVNEKILNIIIILKNDKNKLIITILANISKFFIQTKASIRIRLIWRVVTAKCHLCKKNLSGIFQVKDKQEG